MTITVSISEFRQNISSYLAKVRVGDTIVLQDEKKGEELAEVTVKKQWDSEAFRKALHETAGVLTQKNHPEWTTKKQVIRWVENSRRVWNNRTS